jgi:isopentenyl-diphosphate Delta-isomerase
MRMPEEVILVDKKDRPIGTMEKMEAHRKGVLHRAFSVFIFNKSGLMLLQRRAENKYHSAGLLTNTCCSHPRPGEDTLKAAKRRLKEEMGIECELVHKTTFTYRSTFDNKLIENEVDHVYFGYYDEAPVINQQEVKEYKWMSVEEIKKEIKIHPDQFTSWFRIAMKTLFH